MNITNIGLILLISFKATARDPCALVLVLALVIEVFTGKYYLISNANAAVLLPSAEAGRAPQSGKGWCYRSDEMTG